ncbi:MAG: YbaN family protein [Candidatus Actinomarina sp.]|nr:YbaN family protein [Candidatus Actinomarina sp.]MDG1740927.1 YbaN family protein [Candidatus Actinomarina sp.]MDG2083022.1 YbaN family protein [Candidatus Actinomarina sp.]
MESLIKNIPYEMFSYVGGFILFFVILYKFFPNLFLKIHKPVFFTIGILSLSLGYVGIVVPGLPTTVFILIAAWAFSKCSTKFTYWIENHRLFGPMVLNWQQYRGLSRRAKKVAILTIIPTFAFTIFIAFSIIGDLIFGFFGIALCTWLATRPEPPVKNSN